jgi:type I restriction enzyme S subunit
MGWEVKKLGEVCDDLFAGGDVPKNDFSEEKNDVQNVPIYANGIKNEGLYGYTSKPRVLSPAVTISGRGTIGASFIRTVPFLPIIRLIVAIPSKKVNLVYFAESIKLLNFEGNGISIPQLTIPKVKEYKILLPPLSLQQSFAAKVSAIEAQKQAITQSIHHTEALLAQRMDNYFG